MGPRPAGDEIWDAVATAGRPFGIEPVGEHAIDVARVEAGLLIVGADYTGAGPDRPGSTIDMDDVHQVSPFELRLDSFVDLEKDFVGRDALRSERDGGGRDGGLPGSSSMTSGCSLCTGPRRSSRCPTACGGTPSRSSTGIAPSVAPRA